MTVERAELIKELSEFDVGERGFLSVYASGSPAKVIPELTRQYEQYKRVLGKDEESKTERRYVEANVKMVREYIEKNPRGTMSAAVFCCAELDYFRAVELAGKCENIFWADSSPYIRPLVQDSQHYDNVAIVAADNTKTEVYLVAALKSADRKVVTGNIKNHVRKGGWSQQRYERRRDKQLHLYAKEIVDILREMHREVELSHILMIGSRETLQSIYNHIPEQYRHLVYEKPYHLKTDNGVIRKDLLEMYRQAREGNAQELWTKAKKELFHSGLAAIGAKNVLAAAMLGQVDTALIAKGAKVKGYRCSQCDALEFEPMEDCKERGGKVFEVDMIEEIIELLQATNAEVLFADDLPELEQAGGIAALLRYRL